MVSGRRIDGPTRNNGLEARALSLTSVMEDLNLRFTFITGLALLMAALAAKPASAQYYQYNNGYYPQQYYSNQAYQNNNYYPTQNYGGANPFGGLWNSVKNFFSDRSYGGQNAGAGRTTGGAAGMAAGAFGGAALASALIKSAPGMMGSPIAPILVGTAVTTAGAFLGSKLGSRLGIWGDQTLGPDMTWTTVGAAAGAIAGFTLLPAAGPFAGTAGRVLGGVLGGVAGGVLGKLFAPQVNRLATPKLMYAAAGAAIGGLGGAGIVGALAGGALGYGVGAIFDGNFFANPNGNLRTDIHEAGLDFPTERYAANQLRNDVSSWANYTVPAFQNNVASRLRGSSGYYGQPTAYYQPNYYPNYYYPNAPQNASSDTGVPASGAIPAAPESGGTDVEQLYARQREITANMQRGQITVEMQNELTRIQEQLNAARGNGQ